MDLIPVLFIMITGTLVTGIAHVVLMYKLVVCLEKIKDERVLIAQINSAEKWV